MKENIFISRREKIREKMAKAGIDVFLVSPSSNLFYLSGYGAKGDERLLFLILPLEGEPFILANLLYREQVKDLSAADFVYWKDGEDPFILLKSEIDKRRMATNRAALEPQIPALFSLPIGRVFPDTEFVLGSLLTDDLRQIKDEPELDLIRRASRASDRALGELMDRGSYWIGKTEDDFRDELFAALRRLGQDSPGAAAAVGANAAVPHHGSGKTVIENGKCLLIDFWSRLDGYYTDCTRTFHFGKPGREFEKVYSVVLEAHLAAEAKVKTGNTLGDVDMAARSVIEKNGYGEFFTHRTGHGIGIDIHEGASVNTGVETPIEPGMVFSIEPGIYFPGRFGVRIENLVITRKEGPEILHAFPRELKVIG